MNDTFCMEPPCIHRILNYSLSKLNFEGIIELETTNSQLNRIYIIEYLFLTSQKTNKIFNSVNCFVYNCLLKIIN